MGDSRDFDLLAWIERNVPREVLLSDPIILASWYDKIISKVLKCFPSMPDNIVKEYVDNSIRIAYNKLLSESDKTSGESLLVTGELLSS